MQDSSRNSAHSPPQPSNSPATTHHCFKLGHRLSGRNMLTLNCALFRRAFHPWSSCIVLPVKSVNGFRRVKTVLGPMASLSALQADVFVGFPLAFALTLLATFALEILTLALALVLPTVPREVTKSYARVAILVTMLLQCVDFQRCCVRIIGSTSHLVSS